MEEIWIHSLPNKSAPWSRWQHKWVMCPFLQVRSLVGSSLVLCAGPHRADIEVLVGCILMQRPLPSSFQLLVNPFPCGCITKLPLPPFLSELLTRDHSPLLPCSLLHSMAISFLSRPIGEHFLILHLFLGLAWFRQAHQGRLPLISPRSALTALANPSDTHVTGSQECYPIIVTGPGYTPGERITLGR